MLASGLTMPDEFENMAVSLLGRGGGDILADFAPFGRELRLVFGTSPARVEDLSLMLQCIRHAEAYATWQWDPRMATLRDACEEALTAWCAQPVVAVEVVTALLDLFYFLIWCFHRSNIDQARTILPGMRRFAAGVGRPKPARVPVGKNLLTVAYLTRTADPNSAVSLCMKHVVEALRSRPERFRPLVYVWDHLDPRTAEWIGPLAAPLSALKAGTAVGTAEAVARQAESDEVDIMISDMNTGVPTLIFSRRAAPVQAFLQVGLPAWGTLNLDCVFSGFGFDPALAGWEGAAVYDFLPPWNLDDLKGEDDGEHSAPIIAGLPPDRRVIGCYARLVKMTPDFLRAAERILLARTECCLLLGGTGDGSEIRRFIASSPAGSRMVLTEGFVSGKRWARILDIFLDTWPFQGGGSVREVIVRGVPVVSIHSAEMPAMDREKDPDLIASDWDGYVARVVHLLADTVSYRRARDRALSIADRMSDRTRFQSDFNRDLERTIKTGEVHR